MCIKVYLCLGFLDQIMSLMFALSNTFPDMWKYAYVPIKKLYLPKLVQKQEYFLQTNHGGLNSGWPGSSFRLLLAWQIYTMRTPGISLFRSSWGFLPENHKQQILLSVQKHNHNYLMEHFGRYNYIYIYNYIFFVGHSSASNLGVKFSLNHISKRNHNKELLAIEQNPFWWEVCSLLSFPELNCSVSDSSPSFIKKKEKSIIYPTFCWGIVFLSLF